MNQRHKHYDMIVAWAEGKKLQFSDPIYNVNEWHDVQAAPVWSDNTRYRIKPQKLKYRRYFMESDLDGSALVFCANNIYSYDPIKLTENLAGFIKWIDTEWQEVEL